MQAIGTVTAILNEEYLVIKCIPDANIRPGEILVPFEIIRDNRLTAATGLKELTFPKGELVTVSIQENDYILASTSKRSPVTKTIARSDSPLGQLSGLLYKSALIPTETIIESVPEKRRAALDMTNNLGIKFDDRIKVGDKIGREA